MSKCIYLKNAEKELTFTAEEHIFPAGIGGITKLKLGMVSDEFNTKIFSPIELEFMRNSPVSLPRQFLGPGKRGSLSEKKATKSNIHVLYKETNQEASLGYISLGRPYYISQIKIINQKEIHLSFNRQDGEYMQQVANFANQMKMFKNQYITILDNSLPENDILFGFFNGKWYLAKHNNSPEVLLPEFISKIIGAIIDMEQQPQYDSSCVTCHQQVSFNINSTYRVCAKTAFNFLAHSKGKNFVLQDCFDSVREWIVKGGDNEYVQMINLSEFKMNKDMLFPRDSHWILMSKMLNSLVGMVCFYGNFLYRVRLCDKLQTNYETDGFICDWRSRKEYKLIEFINKLCEN